MVYEVDSKTLCMVLFLNFYLKIGHNPSEKVVNSAHGREEIRNVRKRYISRALS